MNVLFSQTIKSQGMCYCDCMYYTSLLWQWNKWHFNAEETRGKVENTRKTQGILSRSECVNPNGFVGHVLFSLSVVIINIHTKKILTGSVNYRNNINKHVKQLCT